jgi:hypothetical protein
MGLTGTPALNAARRYLYDDPHLIRSRANPPDPRQRIGLAWNIDVHGSGRSETTCISKAGSSRGFTAHMVFVKGRPRGAFVMLNNNPENPPTHAIATELVNSLPAASRKVLGADTCPSVAPSPGG